MKEYKSNRKNNKMQKIFVQRCIKITGMAAIAASYLLRNSQGNEIHKNED